MTDRNYDLADLTGTFMSQYENGVKLEAPVECEWHDEDKMIAHMLLGGDLWTREASATINKGSPYECSHDESTCVYVNCNDLFAWGCADAEPLPHDEVVPLFMLWHENARWGSTKWCCFRRNEQPQAPIARDMKAAGVWCGRMEALPENEYDRICRERAAEKAAAALAARVAEGGRNDR